MKEFKLKYGCNPNQKNAKIFMKDGSNLPIEILNGTPGYINFLDAFNGWQLVKELKSVTKLCSAASFKHLSPTSASVFNPMSEKLKRACFVEDIDQLDSSPLATAYARARGTDRMSSFGDFIALSDTCDETTAKLIEREVSDGVIAPDYTKEALEILKKKKNGNYNIIKIDPNFTPEEIEKRDVFGVVFQQARNNFEIDKNIIKNIVTENKDLPESAKIDLIVALISLKYTQSNSVCFAFDGQAIGIGAGQQSRIHCTRIAADKSDNWFLRQHKKVLDLPFLEGIKRPARDNIIDRYISNESEQILVNGAWQNFFKTKPEELSFSEKKEYLSKITGVSLASDAFFPFEDNIDRAFKSGVSYIAKPSGSIRDQEIINSCEKYGIVLAFTGLRLFHH